MTTTITWNSAINGDWSVGADWNPAIVPIGTNDVLIAATGAPYTVAVSLPEAAAAVTLSAAGATLQVDSTLTMGGPLTLTAGTLDLVGMVAGGSVVLNGGSLVPGGGTLDAVRVQGALPLTQSFGAPLVIKGGLTLTNVLGNGPGGIALTGLDATLTFGTGTQSIASAVAGQGSQIAIGSSVGDSIDELNATGTVTTATLAASVVTNQVGQFATLTASTQAGDSMVNQGFIKAGEAGGSFVINGGSFVNQGTITVASGDNVTIESTNFSNPGTINVFPTSTLDIGQGGTWSSTGVIDATDATVNLLGNVTTAEVHAITSRTGGLVDLAGTMNLGGGTLAVGVGTAIGGLLLTGTIGNGTIADAELGMQFGTNSFPSPTLSGITYQGALDLSENSAQLDVLGAFAVTGSGGGPGTINLTGDGSSLTMTGSRTLDNATIRIGVADLFFANPGTTMAVTFGAHLNIEQAGLAANQFSNLNSVISDTGFGAADSLLNDGEISGSLRNGVLSISGFHSFTNAGQIAFSNGDNLSIEATGVLVNQSTIALGNGVAATLGGANTFDNTGLISTGFGGALTINGQTVENTGTMSIGGGETATINNFTSFANAGGITLAPGATLNIGSVFAAWTSSVKLVSDAATVNLDGIVTQAQIGDISRVGGGVIDIVGTLVDTGATLAVGTGSAFGALELAGEIIGGVIHDTGSGLTFIAPEFGAAPVLDGVTYQGTVDLSEAAARVNVVGGIALAGIAGGAGTVMLTGAGSEMTITGTTVLDNATVDFGAAGASEFDAGATLDMADNFSNTATLLTFGSRLVIQQTGAIATIAGSTAQTDLLINRGSIDASLAGGSMEITGNQFENLGVVNVGNGDRLDIDTSTFTNAGTVNVTTGGTLAVGADGDWISAGKLNETAATVLLQGDVTLPEIDAINRTNGSLVIAGRFNNLGATFNVGAGAPLGDFVLTGTISDGVVNDQGGGFVFQGGTFDTVTYQGVLDLSEPGAQLTVLGGLNLTGVSGTGAGLVNLTGADSSLQLQEPQTFDNATIDIGSADGDTLSVSAAFFGGGPWTTTLGANLLIKQTGANAELSAPTDEQTPDALLNDGTVTAAIAGGLFEIDGSNFHNAGSILVSNGDTMDLFVTSFINTGLVTITTGGVLNLGTISFFDEQPNSWSSTGTLRETGGTINLLGPLTLANLKSITRSGGVVSMSNTADLGGGTLDVGTGSTLGALVVTGTIQNGTVHDADTGLIFQQGVLSNIVYQGTMDLSESGADLVVMNTLALIGLNNSGRATILLTGPNADMTMSGIQTLNNANLSIGGAALEATSLGFENPTPGLLTLGANLTITHTLSSNGNAGIAQITSSSNFESQTTSGVTNLGAINAGLAGGFLVISGAAFTNQGHVAVFGGDDVSVTATTFSNSGVVAINNATMTIGGSSESGVGASHFSNTGSVLVTGGGVLNLGPSNFAGLFTWSNTSPGLLSETGSTLNLNGPVTLANLNSITRSGGTIFVNDTADLGTGKLNLGTGAPLGALVLTGTMQNGIINDTGAGMTFQGNGGAALVNITYQGTVSLAAASSVVTVSGLTLQGPGGTGASTVLLTGSGSAMDVAGPQTLANALVDIGNNASLLSVPGGNGTIATAARLTLANNLMLVHTGGFATLGGVVNFDGGASSTVINLGTVSALVANGQFSINGNSFDNQGVINVGSSDTLSIVANNFTNEGSLLVTTGGVLNLGAAFGGGTWSSTGKLNETGATINLFNMVTLADLNAITRSGGEINFEATLNGAHGTLNVGSGQTLGTMQDTGTISATVIHDTGSGLLFFGPLANSSGGAAVLIGDTYEGTMNMASTLANVTITGGLTSTGVAGTGNGAINLTGAGAVLYAQGSETFNSMLMNIGNAAPLGSTLFQTDPTALGAVLTLGAGMEINQVGLNANILGARNLGDMIVNDGRIFAFVNGGDFLISEGAFTNAGTMAAGTGDTMTLTTDSNFINNGVLQLSGGLIVTPVVSVGATGLVTGNGTFDGQINGAGKIDATGGTLLFDFSVLGIASTIAAGSTLQVNASLLGGSVTYASSAGGALALVNPAAATTTPINGFAGSDVIDLIGKTVTGLSYSGSATSGKLTVSDNSATVAVIEFNGTYDTANFNHVSDGSGGTDIVFVAGGGGGGGGGSGIIVPVGADTVAASSMQFIAPAAAVDASGGNEMLMLPASGMETVSGFSLGNGDVLDLGNALAGSGWNGQASTLGDFVSTSQGGGGTLIDVGHGAGSTVAMLAGVDTSLAQLLAHNAVNFG